LRPWPSGGVFLVLIIGIVYCVAPAAVMGLLGAFTALGLMRLLRKPEARKGAPRADATRR
jgi:hypothetical protein